MVHVNTSADAIPYKLITTEFDLRRCADQFRNPNIEEFGVALVVFGTIFPYLWRGLMLLFYTRKRDKLREDFFNIADIFRY